MNLKLIDGELRCLDNKLWIVELIDETRDILKDYIRLVWATN